ncbi:MAG: hypothetical protein ACTJHC_00255 [Vagococcus sp.]
MKQIKNISLILISLFILSGCVNSITKETLAQNKWTTVRQSDEEDVTLLFDFQPDILVVKLDPDSFDIDNDQESDTEKLGQDLAKKMLDDIEFKVTYKVDDNKLILKSDTLDINGTFKLSKVNEDILLTPTGKKGGDVVTLTPKK